MITTSSLPDGEEGSIRAVTVRGRGRRHVLLVACVRLSPSRSRAGVKRRDLGNAYCCRQLPLRRPCEQCGRHGRGRLVYHRRGSVRPAPPPFDQRSKEPRRDRSPPSSSQAPRSRAPMCSSHTKARSSCGERVTPSSSSIPKSRLLTTEARTSTISVSCNLSLAAGNNLSAPEPHKWGRIRANSPWTRIASW